VPGYVPTVPDVILPVLNEASAIPAVLRALPAGFEPLIVDNASTDGSARVARTHGARVVSEPQRGFGAACWRGLLHATSEVVCFMDCDGSLEGADLVRVAAPVRVGDADLVLGARQPSPGSWPRHARLANRYLARRVRVRTGLHLTDLGPMRAARRADLLALGIRDRRFGWPLEMLLLAAGAGWRVEEVPVAYTPRIGRSKVTGTLLGTARAVSDMAAALR
jgi:glycosyltransferase involved in cell wall biosynthesis